MKEKKSRGTPRQSFIGTELIGTGLYIIIKLISAVFSLCSMILERIYPGISMLVNTRGPLEPHVPRRGQEDRIVWGFLLVQARSGLHFPPLRRRLQPKQSNSTVYQRYSHEHHVIMIQAYGI